MDECIGALPCRPPRGDASSVVAPEVHFGDVDPQCRGDQRCETEQSRVIPVLAGHRSDRDPTDPWLIGGQGVVADAGGRRTHGLRVDDDSVESGCRRQSDGERRSGVASPRRPSLAVADGQSSDGRRRIATRGGSAGMGSRRSQVGAEDLSGTRRQCRPCRVGHEGDLVGQGQAVASARSDSDCGGVPVLRGDGHRNRPTVRIGHRDGRSSRESIGPHGSDSGRPTRGSAEVGLVPLGDPRGRHRQVGTTSQCTRGGHRRQCCWLHVVDGAAGLNQRERNAVVTPAALVEEVVLHRNAEHLLPDHRPSDAVGLSEVVVVPIAPPSDLREPQGLRSEQRLHLAHLSSHAVFFVGIVGPRVGVDCSHVHSAQSTGGDQLLPPADHRLQGRSTDDGGGGTWLHRLHPGVERCEDFGGVGAPVSPSRVVGLVPWLPVGDRCAPGASGRNSVVVGDEGGNVGLPESAVHQGGGQGLTAADLDPVGHLVLIGQKGGLVRIGASRSKGDG